jgi:putative SOS response-associated peptidase YedK
MCGRYTLVASDDQLIAEFELDSCEPVTPSRNICPTQLAPVIRMPEPDFKKELRCLRWGLVPSWSKDPSSAYKMINARSEEVAAKPAFRDAVRRRRCLVPCTGFYEWKAVEGAPKKAKKQAYLFRLEGDRPFALGGLWENWRGPSGEAIESFTILTTSANDTVSPIHDRMPIIIHPRHYAEWLDPRIQEPVLVQELVCAEAPARLNRITVDSL